MQACAALCILSMLFTIGGIVCTILGLLQKVPNVKLIIYKITIGVLLFAGKQCPMMLDLNSILIAPFVNKLLFNFCIIMKFILKKAANDISLLAK